MKRVSREVLRERAHAAGLGRADACVLSILGYWTQVPGGVSKGPGLKWKWRPYAEMGSELAYSISTIQRAVKALRCAKLIETKRIYNPVRSGTNVNAFRLTVQGYELLGLNVPDDATDCSEKSALTFPVTAGCEDGTEQDDWSLEQETNTLLQKTNKHVFGGESEATTSAPSSPTPALVDWDTTPSPLNIKAHADEAERDDW